MKPTLIALLGLGLFGAIFAGLYYAPAIEEVEAVHPAFGLAVGEVRPDYIEPGLAGTPITVHITVFDGPIDIWVMDEEWLASTLQGDGDGFDLGAPFNFHAEWTRFNVSGDTDFEFTATGGTRLALVFDNSDAYYDDTPGTHAARINVQTRYLDQESKSLVYGYLAVIPSVLLVVLTVSKQVRRALRSRVPRTGR